jgi:hypothetical protein
MSRCLTRSALSIVTGVLLTLASIKATAITNLLAVLTEDGIVDFNGAGGAELGQLNVAKRVASGNELGR